MCGSVLGVQVGDFGLGGSCAENVGMLLEAVEQARGAERLDAIISLGDNGYWDGSCAALAQTSKYLSYVV